MLITTVSEAEPFTQDKPLWSIAGLLTVAAFGTSVLAQWVVFVFEQRHGPTSISRTIDTPLSLVRGALLVQSALAGLVFFFLRQYPPLRGRAIPGAKLSPMALGNSLGLVLGLAPVANDMGFRLSRAMHQSPDSARWVTLIVQHSRIGELLLLVVALTLLPALVEELLFRGLFMGALLGAPTSVVLALQALVFGAFHGDVAQGMATFVLGLGFGFIRLKTRTLKAPILSHATYNLVVLGSMRFLHQPDNPPSNQGFGLIVGGMLLSLVCIVGLKRHAERHRGSAIEAQ
jgi:membrane protease YdiL (CAAX protease family)